MLYCPFPCHRQGRAVTIIVTFVLQRLLFIVETDNQNYAKLHSFDVPCSPSRLWSPWQTLNGALFPVSWITSAGSQQLLASTLATSEILPMSFRRIQFIPNRQKSNASRLLYSFCTFGACCNFSQISANVARAGKGKGKIGSSPGCFWTFGQTRPDDCQRRYLRLLLYI